MRDQQGRAPLQTFGIQPGHLRGTGIARRQHELDHAVALVQLHPDPLAVEGQYGRTTDEQKDPGAARPMAGVQEKGERHTGTHDGARRPEQEAEGGRYERRAHPAFAFAENDGAESQGRHGQNHESAERGTDGAVMQHPEEVVLADAERQHACHVPRRTVATRGPDGSYRDPGNDDDEQQRHGQRVDTMDGQEAEQGIGDQAGPRDARGHTDEMLGAAIPVGVVVDQLGKGPREFKQTKHERRVVRTIQGRAAGRRE